MNNLLRKIYEVVICYEKDAVEMGRVIEEEMGELMQPFQEKLTEKQQEELKDLLSVISMSAEREGFVLGIKYTLKILAGLLSD